MEILRNSYTQKAHDDKEDIHNALPDGDLDAIRDYYRDMDSKRIRLKPLDDDDLDEMVNRATKQAIREALSGFMKTGTGNELCV